MEKVDTNHIGDTMRIRRPSKVATDERGRTVWMGEVTPCDLELDSGAVSNSYDSTNVFHWRATAAR